MIPPTKEFMQNRFPKQDWERLDRECEMVFKIFSESSQPKSLVRIGDGAEQAALLEGGSLGSMVANSVKYADCVGICRDGRLKKFLPSEPSFNAKVGAETIRVLHEKYQVKVDESIQIDANFFPFVPYLIGQLTAGRRVCWITSRSNKIMNNLNNPAFMDFYGLHGIVNNSQIDITPEAKHMSRLDVYASIQRQLTEVEDFDLALIGAGVVANLLCYYIKQTLGKSAIDVGVMMSAFKGNPDRLGRDRDFLVWNPAAHNPSDTHD